MPHSDRQPTDHDTSRVFAFGPSEAVQMLTDFRHLRQKIIEAWEERGVMLTNEEQQALKAEIEHTCSLLSALISSS